MFDKLKYNSEYDKKNAVYVRIKLNAKTDADIIKLLDGVENKQGFIKQLLRDKANK